jgi:hypothetical protein
MNILVHLTSDGWRADPSSGEKLETWSVSVETHGAACLTRWVRIWCSDVLGDEGSRALHKRFGSPPLIAAVLQAESAEEVGISPILRRNDAIVRP